MLSHLTPKQIECLEAAAHCFERAQTTANPILMADFVEMAHLWEWLARSYGYTLISEISSPAENQTTLLVSPTD